MVTHPRGGVPGADLGYLGLWFSLPFYVDPIDGKTLNLKVESHVLFGGQMQGLKPGMQRLRLF